MQPNKIVNVKISNYQIHLPELTKKRGGPNYKYSIHKQMGWHTVEASGG